METTWVFSMGSVKMDSECVKKEVCIVGKVVCCVEMQVVDYGA